MFYMLNYKKRDMILRIPETYRRFLKIVIHNRDAPALDDISLKCFSAVYHAQFLLTDKKGDSKLYYGGDIPSPEYDIDAILANIADPKFSMLTLGPEESNPLFSGKPGQSFLESRALLYIIIGIMVLFLGAALFKTMKKIEEV